MKQAGISHKKEKREEKRRSKATLKIAREILAMNNMVDRDERFAEIAANEHMGMKITVDEVKNRLAELQAKLLLEVPLEAKLLLEVPEKERLDILDDTELEHPEEAALLKEHIKKLEETNRRAAVDNFLATEPEKVLEVKAPEQSEKEETVVEKPQEKKPEKVLWPDPAEEQGKEQRQRLKKQIKKDNRKKLHGFKEHDGEEVREDSPPENLPRYVNLEEATKNGNGVKNAFYVSENNGGSMSKNFPLFNGRSIPVCIPGYNIWGFRVAPRKLARDEKGFWLQENAPDCMNRTVWFFRIGHTNIIYVGEKKPEMAETLYGLGVFSAKKIEQPGRETQIFSHIILLPLETGPSFVVTINDESKRMSKDEILIGPYIGARGKNKDVNVKEYLHLTPCPQ